MRIVELTSPAFDIHLEFSSLMYLNVSPYGLIWVTIFRVVLAITGTSIQDPHQAEDDYARSSNSKRTKLSLQPPTHSLLAPCNYVMTECAGSNAVFADLAHFSVVSVQILFSPLPSNGLMSSMFIQLSGWDDNSLSSCVQISCTFIAYPCLLSAYVGQAAWLMFVLVHLELASTPNSESH